MSDNIKVVILAGGLGTRLQEETTVKPKPMIEVGEKPVLWHIMKTYSSFGFNDFVLALGYKGDWIKKYFLNYYHLDHDFSINTKNGHIDIYDCEREDWMVHLVDTGHDTQTGGRLKRLKKFIGNKTFMMTYGDGVANVNIKELLSFHRKNGKLATVTAVRPEARFGEVVLKDNMVEQFIEKPQLGGGWISGGYFVLEPQVLDYIAGDDTAFERNPMERLVAEGQLAAFRHSDFWHPMDTLRDVRFLNDLWAKGSAPWKIWK